VTSPLDGRVADINRRLASVDGHVAELGEALARLQREGAANTTTIAEANTYAGVELRRFGEALDRLEEDIVARLEALRERAYAERLQDAAHTPARSALDRGIQLERPLVLADVGCRWGIPEGWREKGTDLHVYAFDADAEECDRLQADAPEGVTYVPVALGEREQDAQLHITADPACSSLFAPDDEALERFPELASSAQVDVQQVSLQTLDGWASKAGVEAVDAMKLDIQGAELAVLRGAERLLAGVRVIEIEVTFNQMYRGQPLFSEVDGFLREHGFVLWRLAHLVHYATPAQQEVDAKRVDRQFFDSVPVDFPVGGGQLTWAHAYYCAPELVHGGWSSPHAALRDACAAELFGFLELVHPALAVATGHDHRRASGTDSERPVAGRDADAARPVESRDVETDAVRPVEQA
jgi:FkbM family methyltransferase